MMNDVQLVFERLWLSYRRGTGHSEESRPSDEVEKGLVSIADDLCRRGSLSRLLGDIGPVQLILTCPVCKTRHIDGLASDGTDWATKPHHTHACQKCGLTWRPAIVDTVGVQHLPGFKNDGK